ncbi:MAG: hypothetical protein KGL63_11130, partial [Betaproteobacteria bacterium]|nr:hypothetical protein [Betaproteobacteria bacterium]
DAGNYTLTQPTGLSASITPKPITVSATGINKTYDGTTAASVTLGSSGLVSGDSVSFTDTSASFSDKNVGTNKTITVQGIAASGSDATNYTLGNTSANTTASIMPATQTVNGTTEASAVGNATATAYSSPLPVTMAPTLTALPATSGTSASPDASTTFAAPVTASSPPPAGPDASLPASSQPTIAQPNGSNAAAPASVNVVLPGSNGNALLSVLNNGITLPDAQP